MIALTIATSAPGHTQTLEPPMSNSIECGRASPVCLAAADIGQSRPARRRDQIGVKAGVATSTSPTARLPSPGEHLLRRQTVTTRDVTDDRVVLDAFRDDRRLFLSRPGAPAPPR